MKLRAVLWDFDGTLVDSRAKNLRVCRSLVADFTGRSPDDFPALRSLEAYEAANRRSRNWRHLYETELGFSEEETLRAGELWGAYQEADPEPAPPYEGISEVIAHFSALPQGIVSQNCRHEIERALNRAQLEDRFGFVVGHDCVPYEQQKPDPTGLFLCLERLVGECDGRILFIGDHEVDAVCAENANRELERRGAALEVVCIAVTYGHGSHPDAWSARPHHVADSAQEITTIVEALGGG